MKPAPRALVQRPAARRSDIMLFNLTDHDRTTQVRTICFASMRNDGAEK